jgi:ferredoxin-NADP reductase
MAGSPSNTRHVGTRTRYGTATGGAWGGRRVLEGADEAAQGRFESVAKETSKMDDDHDHDHDHDHGDMLGNATNATWSWHDPKPASHAIPWGNIPLGLFCMALFIGGPMARRGVFGPKSFLHRRPLKAMRGGLARQLYIEWATELTTKELILVGLFELGVVLKFIYNWTWFIAVGRPQPAGRAMSHTIGWLMGFSFILPHKRTAILWLTGLPKERAVAFHTLCTQSFYWAATLKLLFFTVGYAHHPMGAGHLLHWDMDPETVMHADFLGRTEPIVPVLGVLCWVSFTLLFLTSMEFVRRNMWDVFRVLHLPLVLCTTILALYHSPGAALSWFSVPFFFLMVDKALLFSDLFCKQTQVLALESLADDACRVVLSRSDSFAFAAGQWVGLSFLNLPGERLGHLGRMNEHPYSISTAPGDGSKFEVVIKSMGPDTWSQKVCDWAKSSPDADTVSAGVNGPYGKLQVQLSDHKHVVLFAGGVGITPLLSIFRDLLQKHDDESSVRCKVVLVWAVREAAQMQWFAEAWESIAESEAVSKDSVFEVRPFVTVQKSIRNPLDKVGKEDPKDATADDEEVGGWSWMKTATGRPAVSDLLTEMAQAFKTDTEENGVDAPGVAVLACGPKSLMQDVHDQAQAAQTPECTFSLHKETFIL